MVTDCDLKESPLMETWTIQKLLNWMTDYFTQKSVDSPRVSAEMLLCHILKLERIELYMHFDRPVSADDLAKLRALVKRAADHEPVAYLVGRTGFYSLDIEVSSACLIPRPETEQLVELAIEFLRTRPAPQYVLDMCTGSGCIAVAIAKGVPDVKVIATDICDDALSVAARNVQHHQLTETVQLLCGDLFAPIIEGLDETRFDLIVSNPPYVSTAEYEALEKNVKDYEPQKALHAGEKGLDIYERIIAETTTHLKPDAALMMEIGYQQGDDIKELLDSSNTFKEIEVKKDFTKNDRIAIAKK